MQPTVRLGRRPDRDSHSCRLVLACRECNAAKADTPLLAFLMMMRSRGVFLLHYGDHLSDPLKELARKASERPVLMAEGQRGGGRREPGQKLCLLCSFAPLR